MHRLLRWPTGIFLFFLALGMLAQPGFCNAASDEPAPLKFAVFPYKSPKSVVEVFGPIGAQLEKKLGRKVQIVSAPDVQSFLERGKSGEYDIALPSVTVHYKLLDGYTVLAKGVPTFRGGAIVRNDSEIKTLEQCRGKRVAAIGEHSYGGYIFFKDLLEEKRIHSKKDVDIQFVGKVDTIIYGVLNKKFDVGVIRADTLDLPDFAPIKKQFRVIASSVEIPQFPFMVKKSLDARTVAAIKEVLVGLSPNHPEDVEILKSLQIEKVVGATNSDYDQFYEVIKNSEYIKH